MRVPQVKSLTSAFPNLGARRAGLIRKLAHAAESSVDLERLVFGSPLHEKPTQRAIRAAHALSALLPQTHRYIRQLHSSPFRTQMWRDTIVLHAVDELLETCGVEPLHDGDWAGHVGPDYEYCNTGYTYASTLIFKRATRNLFIGSWGDIAERFTHGRQED